MYSKNFTKGKNPRVLQGEVFTDKDIPPFMTMEEWNKKHGLGDKKWLQEMKNNLLAEQDMIGVGGYEEPNWDETPFLDADHFRAYYQSHVDPDHDWKNTTHWGPQHQNAFEVGLEKRLRTDHPDNIATKIDTHANLDALNMPSDAIPSNIKHYINEPGWDSDEQDGLDSDSRTASFVNNIEKMDKFAQDIVDINPNLANTLKQDYEANNPMMKVNVSDLLSDFEKIKNESVFKNRRLTEMKKYTKKRINEMVEDTLGNNQLGNGRMFSGIPKDIKYKEGMEVQDINPDCPHRDSRGVVIKVSNGDVTYKVTNWGRHFSPGDELTKSADQLIPLTSTTGYDEDKPWYIAGE